MWRPQGRRSGASAPDRGGDALTPEPAPESGPILTRLLPSVLDGLDPSRRLTVLDLGAATAESVRFFGRFQCRLYFADLLGDTGYQLARRGSRGDGETVFDALLGLPRDAVVDICLCWDLLNCMEEELLPDLARTLTGHVHADTRVHAFIAFSSKQPFAGHRLAIADVDRLTTTAKPLRTPFRHTRKVVERALWPFSIRNATLLSDNRQEVFLMPDAEGMPRPASALPA